MSVTKATQIEIPHVLREAVLRGEAILFLGAGASIGAAHPNGGKIPKGNQLRDALSEKFLGGKMKERPLATVSQFSENESSRTAVQQYIRETFLPFDPAPFHLKIPSFRWHSIATTNYDLIINKAYEQTPNSLQTLIPFFNNGQMIERESRKAQHPLHFLKLHGCIDHISPQDAPLILTHEQYVKYRANRSRLFERLQDWAREFPLVFCGYAISDPNIQEVLFDLFDESINRPMYYVVQPLIDEVEARYWIRHRITPIHATFEQFMNALDSSIAPNARLLQSALPQGTSSLSKFYSRTNITESPELRAYLAEDVLHIRPAMPIDQQNPELFYKGYDSGFGAVAASLDVARAVSDEIILAAVLAEDGPSRPSVELFVVKGAAGNGKTTVLKRAAWDAAHEFDALVLWVRETGAIRGERLAEIYDQTNRRILLVVDRAALRADQIGQCIQYCNPRGVKLSIITAERDNEWNTRCDSLDPQVTESYPVRYLSSVEAEKLVDKLTLHGALGLLTGLSRERQIAAFMERAQRQLLVALHEATQGRPFEEILVDEFNRISPDNARLLYLDICTLNRFGVGVRAGLISRIAGLDFRKFQAELFRPLEKIIFTEDDKYSRDKIYRTRHPHIAEIVFSEVLRDPERRLEQLARIMKGINIDYTVDREAFNQLTRGKNVIDSFPSIEIGRAVYKAAREAVGNDPVLLHQEGLFELNHKGGNLSRAGECLEGAEKKAPHDKSIQHSMANWLRRKALEEPNALVRKEFRNRALTKLANLQTGNRFKYSYEANTRLAILIDELKEATPPNGVTPEKSVERVWVDKMSEIEEQLNLSHQRFPNDEHLLATEASYRKAIADEPRAHAALEKAFAANPRQEWIAVRLADQFEARGETASALEILIKVTNENPSAKQAHLRLGKIRSRSAKNEERQMALQHFRSGFSNGDSNYEAQYWYARQLFLIGQFENSEKMFSQLKQSPLSPSVRNEPREPVTTHAGIRMEYRGNIVGRETTYLFISSPTHGRDIFGYVGGTDAQNWASLRLRDDVIFALAFSYKGPQAIDIRRA
jgi:tetratricopeptide (TPR) repeat protein